MSFMKPAAFLSLLLSAAGFAQQPAAAPLARLQSNIERITKSVNADWGIYIKCLETGEEITLNADKQMDTMSVIKIPLMVEAFRQMEAGKFSLEDKITLKEADKRPGTGIIRSLDPGAVLTIKDLLTLMIIVSDNTATDFFTRTARLPSVFHHRATWASCSICWNAAIRRPGGRAFRAGS